MQENVFEFRVKFVEIQLKWVVFKLFYNNWEE